MSKIELRVPDLGDFEDVPIVEILIAPGDAVCVEDSLVTVESDKATMDIPSPSAGTIHELHVAVGDKVSTGTLLATAEVASAVTDEPGSTKPGVQESTAPSNHSDEDAELVVIGAGPGGYAAAFRAADLGMNVTLIDPRDALGGVCLNVGCIPSKALLHIAHLKEQAAALASHGVDFGDPKIDLGALRDYKTEIVGGLTSGLSAMARARKVTVIQAAATFTSPNTLSLESATNEEKALAFKSCIIAAGSRPRRIANMPNDPRILDSTSALELPEIPDRMLIIGGGIIGLEMATIYSGLGARIDIVELSDGLLAGVDRDLTDIWRKQNAHRFDRIMLSTEVENVSIDGDAATAKFSGANEAERYGLILQSAGRIGNADRLNLASAGLSERGGLINVDHEMRTAQPHICAIGDIVGQPMLAHKATHEGHVAAEIMARHKTAFEPKTIPSVAYTDPEIAWAGETETTAAAAGRKIEIARFPWAASGRALCQGAGYGMTKLIFDPACGRIIGGGVIGPNAGDIISEICLAIEMGADKIDIAKTVHPHPTLGETVGLAAEVGLGVCTDLPRQKPPLQA